VKKVEIEGGARREVEQGSTALNYNPDIRHYTLGGQHMVTFLFLYGGGY
jgi:hypothetical protein